MKKIIVLAALMLLSATAVHAASDYLLKLGGVEGETKTSTTTPLTVTDKGTVGQLFMLDATRSQDDGIISRFIWKQVSGPAITVLNSATVQASFVPTQAGTYVFELRVTDATGRTSVAQKTEVVVGISPVTGTVATPPQEASTDYLIKLPPVDGETEKGNVETGWKVEEGVKAAAPGVEPDEIDVADDSEPVTPDFSILLGGGGGSSGSEEGTAQVEQILLQGVQEAGMPAETMSLNYGKIKTKLSQKIRLFGIFPMTVAATVEIDAEQRVKVKFPWWAALATGKDKNALGAKVFTAVSNVLKTKHDTIKNSIGNIR